jgi:hypothetical protein
LQARHSEGNATPELQLSPIGQENVRKINKDRGR